MKKNHKVTEYSRNLRSVSILTNLFTKKISNNQQATISKLYNTSGNDESSSRGKFQSNNNVKCNKSLILSYHCGSEEL